MYPKAKGSEGGGVESGGWVCKAPKEEEEEEEVNCSHGNIKL